MNNLIEQIQDLYNQLSPDQKEKLFDLIRDDFCKDCGRILKHKHDYCHCMNDE